MTLAEHAELVETGSDLWQASRSTLHMKDGRTVRGRLIHANRDRTIIELRPGERVELAAADIAEAKHVGTFNLPDPDTVRDRVERREILRAQASARSYLEGFPDSRQAKWQAWRAGIRDGWE